MKKLKWLGLHQGRPGDVIKNQFRLWLGSSVCPIAPFPAQCQDWCTPESLLKMKSSFYPCKYIEAHARVSPQVVVVRICAGGGLSPALLAWEAGLLQPFFLFCFVLFCFFLQPF